MIADLHSHYLPPGAATARAPVRVEPGPDAALVRITACGQDLTVSATVTDVQARQRHGHAARRELAGAADPRDGLRRLYYDTVVFDPVILRHLAELVGADRLVIGSDYPFDMAEPRPAGFVAGAGLAPGDTTTILHSAGRLLAGTGERTGKDS